jgi:hypothetical protein
MDIRDYIIEEFNNDKLKMGEDYIFNNLFIYKELRKNINTIEIGIPLLAKLSYYLNKHNATDKNNTYYNLKQAIGRTLTFKIPELNEVNNLSGPLRINYYHNTILNKKIICLGDNHDGTKYSCDDKIITIENYIDKLFKTDIEIDLFLESILPSKEYLIKKDFSEPLPKDYKYENNTVQNDWEEGYLYEVDLYGKRNYKKYSTKRIHFTELRYNELVGFYLLLTIDWKKNPSIYEYKLLTNKNHEFITAIYEYFKYNLSYSAKIPHYLLKEFNRSQTNHILIIKNYILPRLNTYFNIYYNSNIVDELNNIQWFINSCIHDIYTILRIMKNINKSTDFKNCILYYGNAHLNNLDEMLLLFDFKLITSIKSEFYNLNEPPQNGLRCIKNIIPFDYFFKYY